MVCCIGDTDKNTLNANMHFLFIMYLFFKFLVQNCKLGMWILVAMGVGGLSESVKKKISDQNFFR